LQAIPHRRPRRLRSSAVRDDPPQQHWRRVFVANIKSQIKRNATNEKARLRNRAVKSELKTYVRKVKAAVSTGDAAAADAAPQVLSRPGSTTSTRLTRSLGSNQQLAEPPRDEGRDSSSAPRRRHVPDDVRPPRQRRRLHRRRRRRGRGAEVRLAQARGGLQR